MPSLKRVFRKQSMVPEYIGGCPGKLGGCVCSRTLTVSKGCPTNTRHTPPKPPARRFLSGLMGFGRWLPEGGETNCRNLCRSGSRLLIYSLPLFFFLPPTTSSFPPFFCFLFGSRRISGKGKKAFFRPFSFLRLPPSSPPPPFPPPAFLFLFWEVFPGGRPDGF